MHLLSLTTYTFKRPTTRPSFGYLTSSYYKLHMRAVSDAAKSLARNFTLGSVWKFYLENLENKLEQVKRHRVKTSEYLKIVIVGARCSVPIWALNKSSWYQTRGS